VACCTVKAKFALERATKTHRGSRSIALLVCFLVYFHLQRPLKMDLTEGSETSAQLILTPGKYPKESI
jgi:hypothetical protein